MRNHMIGIDDFNIVHRLNISRGHNALTRLLQRQNGFVAIMQPQHDAFQVQQNVNHVLLDAINGGVFVQYAEDLDLRRGVARHRGQQRATQRIAKRMAVATLERLHRNLGVKR